MPEQGKPETKHLARAAQRYQDIFVPLRHAEVIQTVAPVPEDLSRRAKDIKGGAHFLDTSQVGICKIPDNAWYEGKQISGHQYAVVVLVEFGQFPEVDNFACDWLKGVEACVTSTRAAEIVTILANLVFLRVRIGTTPAILIWIDWVSSPVWCFEMR